MVKDSGTTVRTDRLRPLNTPRPVRVDVDERGRPTAVFFRGRSETRGYGDAETRRTEKTDSRRIAAPPPRRISERRVAVRIETILDQWRIDDEWWRKEVSRMYFSVALEGGQLLTLYRDLISGRWYGQTSATPLARGVGDQGSGVGDESP